jgi:hypothetical protein
MFTVCYFCRDQVDPAEVEQLCNSLQIQCEVLDENTTETLILGFSITDSWRKAIKLHEEFKTPTSTVNYNAVLKFVQLSFCYS